MAQETNKMYCRKCIKKGKKICMKTFVKERVYICPECRSKIVFSDSRKIKGVEGL
jgi:Zn finger protein HypA/HybF involved in hydrogenase expression